MTQEFIYRIRSYSCKLDASNTDYVDMLVGQDNFCFSHGLEKKTAEGVNTLKLTL